jgi:hypothetical protein
MATSPVKQETRHQAPAAKPQSVGEVTQRQRGRKKGQPAKEYDFSGLDTRVLLNPGRVSDEVASRVAPQRARDERQVAIDSVVKRVHNDWLEKGQPNKWPAMPKVRYDLPPQAVEGFKYLVRRAADFHGVAVKWGTPTRNQEGLEIVVFAVRDRTRKGASESGPSTSESGPNTENVTGEGDGKNTTE